MSRIESQIDKKPESKVEIKLKPKAQKEWYGTQIN